MVNYSPLTIHHSLFTICQAFELPGIFYTAPVSSEVGSSHKQGLKDQRQAYSEPDGAGGKQRTG
jgi:hypothetical protein